MLKEDLLRSIAEAGYNVGFGAKKHFATFDIVSKVPGSIGYLSTAVGVFALFVEALTAKPLSATFIVLGIAGIGIAQYNHRREAYADAGRRLTELYNELKTLYLHVKATDGSLAESVDRLNRIQGQFNSIALSDQILFSDWYAHYKFFWQHQIGWLDEQLHFRLFRDKIPLSLSLVLALVILASVVLSCTWLRDAGIWSSWLAL